MITLLPYLAGKFFANGEGEAAFHQLSAAFDGHVRRGCEQDMGVVGHDDKGVELEFALVAVAEERCNKKLGDGVPLEDAAALVGDGGERVGLGFEALDGRACPRG
jgi:hypothetical protein